MLKTGCRIYVKSSGIIKHLVRNRVILSYCIQQQLFRIQHPNYQSLS
jgi:hypothetical protein